MKKVQVDGLGEITFKKSAKAKYIKLRVEPFKGIVVTVPTYLGYEFGLNAVMGRYEWLSKHLSEIKEKENSLKYTLEDFPIKTKNYEIDLEIAQIDKFKRRFVDGKVLIYIPHNMSFPSVEVQEYVSECVNKVLKTDAKLYLIPRTRFFAQKFNLDINKVTIRNTKTRWGSCSYQNNISLSYHLMKIPDELIDYVILHELAHTKEKNHQKPFWNFLDTLCVGQAKKLDKELKKFNHLILR